MNLAKARTTLDDIPDRSEAQLRQALEASADEIVRLAKALQQAEQERDAAWNEQRAIREAIGANAEEATIDEVNRVIEERNAAYAEAERLAGMLQYTAEGIHFGNNHRGEFHLCMRHICCEYRRALARQATQEYGE